MTHVERRGLTMIEAVVAMTASVALIGCAIGMTAAEAGASDRPRWQSNLRTFVVATAC